MRYSRILVRPFGRPHEATGNLHTILPGLVLVISLALPIGLWCPASHADDAILNFAGALGGVGIDRGHDVSVDAAGNVYLTGQFRVAGDFDPGPGTSVLTGGWFDVYVCKLDAGGTLQWARSMGGTSVDYGFSVAADDSENVFCTGLFNETADFDPGPGVFNLTSAGEQDAFLCKLDSAGNFLWAFSLGGTSGDAGSHVATDGAGNVYLVGSFSGAIDFDPGPGTYTVAASSGPILAKYDAMGNFLWAGPTGGFASGIEVDPDGTVYLAGSFLGTTDFDPGPGVYNLTSTGAADIFVSKLNHSGTLQWALAIGSTNQEGCYGIATGPAGELYCTGRFQGTVDFDPGPGVFELTSNGSRDDIFVLRLDTDGAFYWGAVLGGRAEDNVAGIAADPMGGVYCAGWYLDWIDADPGPAEFRLNSVGQDDIYVCKLDSDGAFRWAKSMGGPDFDRSAAVAVDRNGFVYLTGYFETTADFDPSTGVYNLVSAGEHDAYVLKLEPLAPPVANADTGETDADRVLTMLSDPASASVLSNDTDVNAGDMLTVVTFDARSTLGAGVAVNPDGTFVYDPGVSPRLQELALGYTDTDSFTYTVSDGANTSIGTVTITVHGKGIALPAPDLAWKLALLLVIAIGGAYRIVQGSGLPARKSASLH